MRNERKDKQNGGEIPVVLTEQENHFSNNHDEQEEGDLWKSLVDATDNDDNDDNDDNITDKNNNNNNNNKNKRILGKKLLNKRKILFGCFLVILLFIISIITILFLLDFVPFNPFNNHDDDSSANRESIIHAIDGCGQCLQNHVRTWGDHEKGGVSYFRNGWVDMISSPTGVLLRRSDNVSTWIMSTSIRTSATQLSNEINWGEETNNNSFFIIDDRVNKFRYFGRGGMLGEQKHTKWLTSWGYDSSCQQEMNRQLALLHHLELQHVEKFVTFEKCSFAILDIFGRIHSWISPDQNTQQQLNQDESLALYFDEQSFQLATNMTNVTCLLASETCGFVAANESSIVSWGLYRYYSKKSPSTLQQLQQTCSCLQANLTSGIRQIETTYRCTVVLRNDGHILLFGDANCQQVLDPENDETWMNYLGSHILDAGGVQAIYTTQYAIALRLQDSSFVAISGNLQIPWSPGPKLSSNNFTIYRADYAFLYVSNTNKNDAAAFGCSDGANSTGVDFTSGIKQVAQSDVGFAAWMNNGRVYFWGLEYNHEGVYYEPTTNTQNNYTSAIVSIHSAKRGSRFFGVLHNDSAFATFHSPWEMLPGRNDPKHIYYNVSKVLDGTNGYEISILFHNGTVAILSAYGGPTLVPAPLTGWKLLPDTGVGLSNEGVIVPIFSPPRGQCATSTLCSSEVTNVKTTLNTFGGLRCNKQKYTNNQDSGICCADDWEFVVFGDHSSVYNAKSSLFAIDNNGTCLVDVLPMYPDYIFLLAEPNSPSRRIVSPQWNCSFPDGIHSLTIFGDFSQEKLMIHSHNKSVHFCDDRWDQAVSIAAEAAQTDPNPTVFAWKSIAATPSGFFVGLVHSDGLLLAFSSNPNMLVEHGRGFQSVHAILPSSKLGSKGATYSLLAVDDNNQLYVFSEKHIVAVNVTSQEIDMTSGVASANYYAFKKAPNNNDKNNGTGDIIFFCNNPSNILQNETWCQNLTTPHEYKHNIMSLHATSNVVVALLFDGTVVFLGNPFQVMPDMPGPVKSITAGQYEFLAVLEGSRSVVTFQRYESGVLKQVEVENDIDMVVPLLDGFALLLSNGDVYAWRKDGVLQHIDAQAKDIISNGNALWML